MNKAVWKFVLPVSDTAVIRMPTGAVPLHVGVDPAAVFGPNALALWALVDITEPVVQRTFYIRGTGHLMQEATVEGYIGTVTVGSLVWHIFEAI